MKNLYKNLADMLTSCYTIIMIDYSYSTLSLITSLSVDVSTMKRISASRVAGEITDGNIVSSLFELPEEILEKIEKESNPNNPEANRHER